MLILALIVAALVAVFVLGAMWGGRASVYAEVQDDPEYLTIPFNSRSHCTMGRDGGCNTFPCECEDRASGGVAFHSDTGAQTPRTGAHVFDSQTVPPGFHD